MQDVFRDLSRHRLIQEPCQIADALGTPARPQRACETENPHTKTANAFLSHIVQKSWSILAILAPSEQTSNRPGSRRPGSTGIGSMERPRDPRSLSDDRSPPASQPLAPRRCLWARPPMKARTPMQTQSMGISFRKRTPSPSTQQTRSACFVQSTMIMYI